MDKYEVKESDDEISQRFTRLLNKAAVSGIKIGSPGLRKAMVEAAVSVAARKKFIKIYHRSDNEVDQSVIQDIELAERLQEEEASSINN